jgi:hypothetical protein
MTTLLAKYNWTSVIVFVSIIVIAHLFASSPYDWKNNTVSELAAQNYNHKWIMKTGFILFGSILSVGIVHKLVFNEGKILFELPILIYGLAILISGVFSTKPFIDGIAYSQTESMIHSYAAMTAGISFSIGILIFGITSSATNLKLIHFTTFIFVVGFSALFGILTNNIGIIQRVMYTGSFAWILFFYNK